MTKCFRNATQRRHRKDTKQNYTVIIKQRERKDFLIAAGKGVCMMNENNYNYDPMTGEKLVREQPSQSEPVYKVSYDPMTGEKIYTKVEETPRRAEAGEAPVNDTASENMSGAHAERSEAVESFRTEAERSMEGTQQRTESAYQAQAETMGPEKNGAAGRKASKRVKAKEKKKGGFFRKAVAAIVLAVLFGGAAGGTFYGVCYGTGLLDKYEQAASAGQTAQEQVSEAVPIKQVNVTDEEPIRMSNSANVSVVTTDISDVVEEVVPAMVTILNTSRERQYDFWGNVITPQYSGSGIIVGENDEEILITTNHHVAANADKLEITFIDGTTAEAKVKGMDSEMDLAVIAVALEDLTPETKDAICIAQLGDSDSLKLGQPAIVIGNALGIGISVTNGVISGLDREMTSEDGTTGTFIQTDAAVNHGNSGGALLNVKGEVIGITSGKIQGADVDNMGYAIPINAANPIISELMEHQTRKERVSEDEMGYLGVSLQAFDDNARRYYNIPEGAFVYSVFEGSGAEAAGIYKGDVITKVENEKVSSVSDVKAILEYYKQGDVVKVTVKRLEAGEYVTHDFEVTLGAASETD